jgi:UDP-N-acetylmuramate dehydrogenase
MNAGMGKSEIGAIVEKVWAISLDGKERIFTQKQCKFGYRKSLFKNGKYIITKVQLRTHGGSPKQLISEMRSLFKERLKKQPYSLPSAGSFFKNPQVNPAGKLIEEAGCKGMKVGGAMVSEKHANFLVNTGNATAKDVLGLVRKVEEAVRRKFNIKLQPEVVIVSFPRRRESR